MTGQPEVPRVFSTRIQPLPDPPSIQTEHLVFGRTVSSVTFLIRNCFSQILFIILDTDMRKNMLFWAFF
ncbi:hypothetical protein SAMN05421747_10493 [Parapedobacter composti]|uniref:Uncharacterized protein n=1 Tax=Parapedobacter composti TaxID=623281 RepID=A0A1I1GBC9_9SPHI|nr:hypothetical protein SAMN05421747_10493 [Parapedobacter composti]